jgi:hypothetical protein
MTVSNRKEMFTFFSKVPRFLRQWLLSADEWAAESGLNQNIYTMANRCVEHGQIDLKSLRYIFDELVNPHLLRKGYDINKVYCALENVYKYGEGKDEQ